MLCREQVGKVWKISYFELHQFEAVTDLPPRISFHKLADKYGQVSVSKSPCVLYDHYLSVSVVRFPSCHVAVSKCLFMCLPVFVYSHCSSFCIRVNVSTPERWCLSVFRLSCAQTNAYLPICLCQYVCLMPLSLLSVCAGIRVCVVIVAFRLQGAELFTIWRWISECGSDCWTTPARPPARSGSPAFGTMIMSAGRWTVSHCWPLTSTPSLAISVNWSYGAIRSAWGTAGTWTWLPWKIASHGRSTIFPLNGEPALLQVRFEPKLLCHFYWLPRLIFCNSIHSSRVWRHNIVTPLRIQIFDTLNEGGVWKWR